MIGPKLSSRISSIEWSTWLNTVGSNQWPGAGRRAPPMSSFAPLSFASATCRSSTSSCGARVSGPMYVSSLAGSPSLNPRTSLTKASTNAS